MSDYSKIHKLKSRTYISNQEIIEYDDLFLKDENGQTFLDYIIKERITINNKKLIEIISNDYELLYYTISNGYFLDQYYNIDLLLKKRKGKSLIELAFEKKPINVITMHPDIINKLFEKTEGQYPIYSLLKIDSLSCQTLIKKIMNFNTLYNCLTEINRLDLMKYANENILLHKMPTNNSKTMLEELIKMNVNISDITNDKTYYFASILYQAKQYETLLKMDCEILLNYPDRTNNYLQLLIQKYQSGENIPFKNIDFSSSNNHALAETNILLLKNNIDYLKPSFRKLINPFNFDNHKPLLLYMLEINQNLVLENFNNNELINNIKKYLNQNYNFKEEEMQNLSLKELLSLFPQKKQFEQDLKEGKIKVIEKSTYYADCLLETLENGMTIYEYALINGIKIKNFTSTLTPQQIILLIKYKQDILFIDEKCLYKETKPNEKVIDILFKNKYYNTIKYSIKRDLQIINYCLKYDNFGVLNDSILDELFVITNNHFLAEKLLANKNFKKALTRYQMSTPKIIKLYQLGYKELIINAHEDVLLSFFNNHTILDDLLNSGITPTFYNYNFKSLKTLNILLAHNRLDLLYNADLHLLMDYPDKENNYLQMLINNYKKGINVNFEIMAFKFGSQETVARCYIQMTKNGLKGFLDELDENDLLKKDENNQSLLYYLINLDKDLTIQEIIKKDVLKKETIFTELKMLGVQNALLNLSYDKFNCNEIYLDVFNEQYTRNIKSPAEELLKELRSLFEKDGKSDMKIIDALITSYRYCTTINPLFIQEIQILINIKKQNPDFCYIKDIDGGYFSQSKGVVVSDNTISTLNHETGHAIHYYMTSFDIPDDYEELITSIGNNPNWLIIVNQYSKKIQELLKKAREKAKKIVEMHIIVDEDKENKRINEMLNMEKEKLIQKYLEKGYSRESLDTILSSSFTKDQFIAQKKQIEIEEMVDSIMRTEYDAFIAIGDIIDAISSGKFRSNLLYNNNQELIQHAYGHGVKYYCQGNSDRSLEIKFTEMIANYSTIIKSKHSIKMIELLRIIVGNDLVNMLDNFYKYRMLKGQTYESNNERTK